MDSTSGPPPPHLLISAFAVLEQSPPPSLREILAAYRAKGDGDRDMLLAMLNAKAAEDQRLASVAALHRSVLDVYNGYSPPPPPPVASDRCQHYPTPTFSLSPQLNAVKHSHPLHYSDSTSRSPPPHHTHLPPLRDALYSELPRKRHRSSPSPTLSYATYDQPPPHREQLPPSPYSSSERSEPGEYSPRSRGSMAIGSLLSSRPNQQLNGDES